MANTSRSPLAWSVELTEECGQARLVATVVIETPDGEPRNSTSWGGGGIATGARFYGLEVTAYVDGSADLAASGIWAPRVCFWQLVLAPALQLLLAPPCRLATPFGPTPELLVLLFDAAFDWSRWGQNQLLQWSPNEFAGSPGALPPLRHPDRCPGPRDRRGALTGWQRRHLSHRPRRGRARPDHRWPARLGHPEHPDAWPGPRARPGRLTRPATPQARAPHRSPTRDPHPHIGAGAGPTHRTAPAPPGLAREAHPP